MLTIICAVAENNAIGYNNDLLYHLREDLRRFKALTTGHTIIMGRRTFDSLPKGALPNRRNIVLTSDTTRQWPGVEVFTSLTDALTACSSDEEVFVIGGASVYAAALPLADRLCLTLVHATPAAADVFFPTFDADDWECTFSEDHEADDHNEQPYTFVDYVRK